MSSARGIASLPLLTAAVLAAVSLTHPAAAQPAPQPPGTSTSPGLTHPEAVDDQDLRSFAAATAKIRIIDREYTKKKDGKSEAERATLSAAENKENLAAVADAGLTPTKYNAISKAIQEDPALAKKAYEYIYAAPVK